MWTKTTCWTEVFRLTITRVCEFVGFALNEIRHLALSCFLVFLLQTFTPHMQSGAAKAIRGSMDSDSSKLYRRTSSSIDQQQGNFSLELWKMAFRDACERICPVRAGGHNCGCLPVLSKLVVFYTIILSWKHLKTLELYKWTMHHMNHSRCYAWHNILQKSGRVLMEIMWWQSCVTSELFII